MRNRYACSGLAVFCSRFVFLENGDDSKGSPIHDLRVVLFKYLISHVRFLPSTLLTGSSGNPRSYRTAMLLRQHLAQYRICHSRAIRQRCFYLTKTYLNVGTTPQPRPYSQHLNRCLMATRWIHRRQPGMPILCLPAENRYQPIVATREVLPSLSSCASSPFLDRGFLPTSYSGRKSIFEPLLWNRTIPCEFCGCQVHRCRLHIASPVGAVILRCGNLFHRSRIGCR